MSDLIELLADLALLESTPLDMDRRAMSLIFSIKEQADDFCADFTMSANLAAASRRNDEYYMVSIPKLVNPLRVSLI